MLPRRAVPDAPTFCSTAAADAAAGLPAVGVTLIATTVLAVQLAVQLIRPRVGRGRR